MTWRLRSCSTAVLLTEFLLSSVLSAAAFARANSNQDKLGQTPAVELVWIAAGRHGRPAFLGSAETRRETFYKHTWGVDEMAVRTYASGSMLQFRYRVLDASKARALNDKQLKPYLIDERTGTKLKVLEAERIGNLRTTAEPEAGRVYWVMFGNSAGLVRRGSRVTVEIGDFHANGLLVE